MISFSFPSDWLRERRKFSGLITEWSKVKLIQSWITFNTELIVALKGTLVAKHIKNVHFTKQCYLYPRCLLSLQDQHFTEKVLLLIEELHCWNTFAFQADNQSLVIPRDTLLKKPGKWKPNKYFLLDCMGFILSLPLYFILTATQPPFCTHVQPDEYGTFNPSHYQDET